MTRAAGGDPSRSAAEWFAVMRGPAAGTEREAFDAWRAVPSNAAAYARLEATWAESRFLANGAVAKARNLSRARRSMPSLALLAAGIAALMLIPAVLLVRQTIWLDDAAISRSAPVQFAAQAAVGSFRLSDGSRLTLDRGAAVLDLSSASERRFLLLRGRARFEVAHHATRRFVVDAGGGRVIAHGTIFDVTIEGNNVHVILVRGSVEVRSRGGKRGAGPAARFLSPGHQLFVIHREIGSPSLAEPGLLSWPDAMISFDAMPLGQAISAFNRASGGRIRLADAAAAGRRVSGAFRRDDPRGFADSVAASFGLRVQIAADGNLVLHASAPERP